MLGGVGVFADFDFAGFGDHARTHQTRHLIFLKQKIDALGQVADDAVLARQHGGQVKFGRGYFDAVPSQTVPGLFEQMRRLQQRLGRNTADIETRAAQGFAAVYARGFQTQLRGANCGHVATRPRTDEDDVEGCVGHV